MTKNLENLKIIKEDIEFEINLLNNLYNNLEMNNLERKDSTVYDEILMHNFIMNRLKLSTFDSEESKELSKKIDSKLMYWADKFSIFFTEFGEKDKSIKFLYKWQRKHYIKIILKDVNLYLDYCKFINTMNPEFNCKIEDYLFSFWKVKINETNKTNLEIRIDYKRTGD